MVSVIYWVIIAILVAEFVLNRVLAHLNVGYSSRPLPKELEGIYGVEEYAKQQLYFKVNARMSLITSSVSFLFTLCMFAFGGYAYIDALSQSITANPVLVTMLFWAILIVVGHLIDLPFDCYCTFGIEERFGFNRTTPKTFVGDFFKQLLLMLFINCGLFALLVLIYMETVDWFWILAWAVFMAITLFLNVFYSELIVPLFNKQTPLPDGELRTAIDAFAKRVDFKIKDIYVLNSSKRSTKANAYFTGFGKKKRIVLYDTLIEQLTVEEIVAVLAHEIGHNKHRHTLKNLAVSCFSSLLLFFLLGIILRVDVVAQAAGCAEASFHVNLLMLSLLYTPISMVLGIAGNILSRRFEYQADAFVKEAGMADALISALKKISSQALSNLNPHPKYVFFNYSHPTLYQRIRALK